MIIEDTAPSAYDLATEELLSKLLKKGVSVHLCPNRKEGFDGVAEYKGERFLTYKQPTIGAVAYHLWTQIEKKEMKIQRQGARKRRRALWRSLRE